MYLDVITPKEINTPNITETIETINEEFAGADTNFASSWFANLLKNRSAVSMIVAFIVLAIVVVVYTKSIIQRELKNVKEV